MKPLGKKESQYGRRQSQTVRGQYLFNTLTCTRTFDLHIKRMERMHSCQLHAKHNTHTKRMLCSNNTKHTRKMKLTPFAPHLHPPSSHPQIPSSIQISAQCWACRRKLTMQWQRTSQRTPRKTAQPRKLPRAKPTEANT